MEHKLKKIGNQLQIEIVFAIQILFTCVVFISIWILQYIRKDGNSNMLGRISFRSEDPPWMPPGQNSQALIGFHHFGDWALNVGWAMHENCYNLANLSCQQPPLGNWILRIFGVVNTNYGYAYVAWILIAVLLYAKLISKSMAKFSILQKVIFFFFMTVFTSGNIISLDRGSLHFMAFALLGLTIMYYMNGEKLSAIVFLTLAVSLKPQLFLATIYLLKDRKIKDFLWSIFIPIISNFILIFTFPGNFISNINGYLQASNGYVSSKESFGNMMNSVSLVGIVSRVYEFLHGWDTFELLSKYSTKLFLPGLLYLALICLAVLSPNISDRTKLVSVLSTINLVIPSSGPYLLGWGTILLTSMFLNMSLFEFEKYKHDKFLFVALILLVNTPGFILIDDIPGFSRHVGLIFTMPILVFLLISSEVLFNSRKVIQN
jgi:hypothetical protein